MKINYLEIKNMLGVSQLSLEMQKPVTLICGPNGAGKSSIQNAIKMALTGSPTRVVKKGDYDQLITEGHRKASISIGVESAQPGHGDSYGIDLPKGAKIHSDNEFLPFVLEPAAFAALDVKERRTLLFNLTKSARTDHKVEGMVQKRGCNMQLFANVKPLLRAGFPEAEKQCKENARDEKAIWKATTGETWGSDKAEGWKPEPVQFDAELLAEKVEQYSKADERFGDLNRKLGGMQQQQQNRVYAMEEKQKLSEACEDINRKLMARDSAKKRVEEQEARVRQFAVLSGEASDVDAMPCPCCNASLVVQDGKLVEFKGVDHDPEAAEKLKEHSEALVMLRNALKNAEQAYQAAFQAQEKWKTLEVPDPIDDSEFKKLQDDITLAREMKNELQVEIEELKTLKEKAAQVQRLANQAEETHGIIMDWLALAEALGPNGIPAELLAKTLKPINERLAQSAADAGAWMTPEITTDMEILAEGRPYYLLSESEKWRTDAMLAEAISFISGLKLLCLDRFDVIQPSGRGFLFQWLQVLAEQNEIDTCLVFGTLKQCPPSKDWRDCYWMEGGELMQREPGLKKAS